MDLFDSGRWGFTLNLIDHLPRTSAYAQAVAEDDELAGEIAAHVAGGPRRPPMSEWSPEVEVLAIVADRLAEVANTIIGVNGGKPARIQPLPRPVTAIDRARARLRREAAAELERKLFPDGEG